MVELAKRSPRLGLIGVQGRDAGRGQAIEDAKLLLPQPLVEHQRLRFAGQAGGRSDEGGRAAGAAIERGDDDLRPLLGRKRREPAAEGLALPFAEAAERHIDIAVGQVDMRLARAHRGPPGDVTGALAVPDDPQLGGPGLGHVVFLGCAPPTCENGRGSRAGGLVQTYRPELIRHGPLEIGGPC